MIDHPISEPVISLNLTWGEERLVVCVWEERVG